MSLADKLMLLLQRCIPARMLGNVFYVVSRSRVTWFKNALIRGFVWLYKVNVSEAVAPVPEGYRSFNDFFTRDLRPGARPLCAAPDFACPVDGTVAQIGHARNGQLLQAKGMQFSAAALLGDARLGAIYKDAGFATLYLAPPDYHRIHMPLDGRLLTTIFVPGKLYSVNARTTASVPGLYALNERLVCQFEGEYGPFAVVLVGAINVASISTAWDGEIPAPREPGIVRRNYADDAEAPRLERGQCMGQFNMGSTVIVLAPPQAIEWAAELTVGTRVSHGQSLGRVGPSPQ